MKHIRTLEEWRDIKGYEGLYQVSDLGRVKRLAGLDARGHMRQERILKGISRNSYKVVNLSKDGKRESFYIHRLVAEAFIPNPDNLPEVNHCNERRDDNKAFNLDWVSAKENMNYGFRTERAIKNRCKKVLCIETNIVYPSTSEAGRQTGINQSGISRCCNGAYKTAGGYHWEYVIE